VHDDVLVGGEAVGVTTGDVQARLSAESRMLDDARSGDAVAFVGLLRRHEPRLRALAFRVLRDPELVADALQETALRAFRFIGDFRGEASLGTWLYRITYTSCLDLLEGTDRQLRLAERLQAEAARRSPDPAELIAAEDRLSRALDSLSPEQRAAVFLCIQQGQDLATAATILGVPYGTVGSRLSHARRVLREALSTDEGGAR
jgi:RNA polymerase sigma-70 factor (ECF subfamily)